MDSERTTEEEREMQIGFDRGTYGVSRADLDEIGERAARDNLNTGKYGHPGLAPFAFVSAWLADAEFARSQADAAKRDAREAETLSIAKSASFAATAAAAAASDANTIARSNRLIAIAAAIIAAIAAAIAAYAATKGVK